MKSDKKNVNLNLYDKFCEDISDRVAKKLFSKDSNCGLDVVRANQARNIKYKNEVIEYLQNNRVPEYTPDEIERILENQRRIEEEERKKSDLASNYIYGIKVIMWVMVFTIALVMIVASAQAYDLIEYKFFNYVFTGYLLEGTRIGFIVVTALAIILPVIYALTDNKIPGLLVVFPLFLLVVYFAMITIFIEQETITGYANMVGGAFLLFLCDRVRAVNGLSKADAYNVMIFFLTIVALIMSGISIVLTIK